VKIDANSASRDPAVAPAEGTKVDSSVSESEPVAQGKPVPDVSEISALAAQAMALADVRQGDDARESKVDALRRAISNGQYKVEPDKIAEAILQESPKL
jgi:flagellar biosynthesis anti-sigma factor FlgM